MPNKLSTHVKLHRYRTSNIVVSGKSCKTQLTYAIPPVLDSAFLAKASALAARQRSHDFPLMPPAERCRAVHLERVIKSEN